MINIAIVDDNRVDLNEEVQITEEYFRKKGLLCRVEPFEDPDWMIRGIKEEQYDIYIMDIRMDDMRSLRHARVCVAAVKQRQIPSPAHAQR